MFTFHGCLLVDEDQSNVTLQHGTIAVLTYTNVIGNCVTARFIAVKRPRFCGLESSAAVVCEALVRKEVQSRQEPTDARTLKL